MTNSNMEEVKLGIGDFKEVFKISKEIENFEILYVNLFFYYSKIQSILISHKEEIYEEFRRKLFTIVSFEEFRKKNLLDNNQFLLDPKKVYYGDKKEKNFIKVSLFLSSILNLLPDSNREHNLKIFFSILTILNKYNPGEKILFGAEQCKKVYPIISKEVYGGARGYYILEPNEIIDWFKVGVFLYNTPSKKIRVIKEKISGAEKTKYNVIFYGCFSSLINNLKKIDFTKLNDADKKLYKPYLAVWFYNHFNYLVKKGWLDKRNFFEENVIGDYNTEDFLSLFDRYFLPYVIAENPDREGLKELALLIK